MDWAKLIKDSPWILLVGGAALGWLRNFWSLLYGYSIGYFVRKLHVSIAVEEHETEEAYMWIALWAEKRIREKRITDLMLRRKRTLDGTDYQAIPRYGTYYLRFQRRYLLIFTSDKESGTTPGASGGVAEGASSFFRPRRTISISIWGTLDRQIITDLIAEARTEFYAQLEKKLFIYHNEGSWWDSRELSPRSLDTIYLPDGTIETVVDDAKQFLAIKDKYRLLGIPWRRGFLLYGPPGTGKSSLVQALATNLELPLYYLNVAGIERSEDLQRLINAVSNRSILLIEDIDCIPAARERKFDKDGDEIIKGVIASDLLNVIDGVVATEGRLLIITTNHRDKLDAALIRKGRIDREFHVTWARDEELRRFHARAQEVFSVPDYAQFRGQLPEKATIADAQALLFGRDHEPELLSRLRVSPQPNYVSHRADQANQALPLQMPSTSKAPLGA
jgi:mitochondrial chaperone BCS1